MKKRSSAATPKPVRVAEPVQVYLAGPDLDRLSRLAASSGLSKSDVLRRGLAALEAQVSTVAEEPTAPYRIPTSGTTGGLRPGLSLERMSEVLDVLDLPDDAAP